MHTVALHTYGTDVRHGRTCLKCTQIVPTILLQLFGECASDWTPSGSAYHYIHLLGLSALWDGFLLLKLTDEEKRLVEGITRAYRGAPQTFLWQDNHWYEFPCSDGSPLGHLDYRLASPATCATSYPRALDSAAPFLTPLQMETSAAVDDVPNNGITIQRSDRAGTGKPWWWIGGDTKPVKDVLSQAGARWSRRRQQWYYIGETLPDSIHSLTVSVSPADTTPRGLLGDSTAIPNKGAVPSPSVSVTSTQASPHTPENATPVSESRPDRAGYTATPIRTMLADSTLPEEAVMRSVQTDDVQAALIAHVHDWERAKPILIDFVGSRNAVKQLLAKPFSPSNIGRGDGVGFTIVNGSSYTNFRLPDANYKALSASHKNRAVEGRIVALDATTAAPKQECYVLVSAPIRIPDSEDLEVVADTWLRYVRYMQTPNRAEFAQYDPPVWVADLYNVYQALRVRLGRPLHVRWMPWLFQQVADKSLVSPKLGVSGAVVCKYIAGYVAPKAVGLVEQGAYRLTCSEASDLWGEIILANPIRAEGISFDGETKGAAS